jgi:hypothetical protein
MPGSREVNPFFWRVEICNMGGGRLDLTRRIPMALRFLADFLRRPVPETSEVVARGRPAGSVDTRFRAVSIRAGDESCEAARQFGRLRFLGAKAPRLPVPECDAANCTCRYVHYSDRRSGTDRRATYDWTRERQLGVVNRRAGRGRRGTDAIG